MRSASSRADRSCTSGSSARSRSPASPRSAGRRWRSSPCRPRSGCSTRRAGSTRSTSPPKPARPRSSSSTQIRPLLGPSAQVRTGQQQAQQATKDTSGFLNIFQDFLLAFGGIALFVGSFVIANTLSITIAQRTRELATLRTLGATRRQVLRSVLLEAFVIGVLASIVGLFLGLGAREGPQRAVRLARDQPPERRAPCSRPARSSSRWSSASGSPCSPRCGRRCARRACRRSPPCARERCCRPRGSPATALHAAVVTIARRRRADAGRPVRARPLDRHAPACDRGRRGGAVHRRLDARAAARAADRARARSAGRPVRRRRRIARPGATRSATRRGRRRPRRR